MKTNKMQTHRKNKQTKKKQEKKNAFNLINKQKQKNFATFFKHLSINRNIDFTRFCKTSSGTCFSPSNLLECPLLFDCLT